MRWGLHLTLAAALAAACAVGIGFGETALTSAQVRQAFADPGSAPGEVLWAIRAPRVAAAVLVGGALGFSGAVMQGLLRNPLADPGVLGVSAFAGLGAALAISAGLGASALVPPLAALAGALVAGALLTILAARLDSPQSLILFGVALSAFGGAGTALVFNLSPSPIATADVLSWLLGSVANRDWTDVARALPAIAAGAVLAALSLPGLRTLTLGAEAARTSGLPMGRLRALAVAGTALMTGAAVALSGVIGFVGLAAPHAVRRFVDDDPAAVPAPSAAAGAILLVIADIAARTIPTAEPLKLGVMTALVGAPVFCLIAWRAARSWAS